MVIVLIKWKIRPQERYIDEFLEFWKQRAVVEDRRGLIGEFLSEVGTKARYPYINWNVSDGDDEGQECKVFINVGIWADGDSFHEQIGQYFNDNKPPKEFEFKPRTRTVLIPKCWRMGDALLPKHDSGGVL